MASIVTIIIAADTKITDSTFAPRDLINSMTIRPGSVSISNLRTNENAPVTAMFIPEDESVQLSATSSTSATDGATNPTFTWGFTWDSVPEFGPRALLRFEEMLPSGGGSIVNFTIGIVSELNQNNPGLDTNVGGLGGGGPIGP